MARDISLLDETPTLSFDQFWDWLILHPNCILRVGSPDAVLYDDEDYHWQFTQEGLEAPVIQVLRGKRLVGELLVIREPITYVQGSTGEVGGEYVFELIAETETDRIAAYFFVLSHGYDVEQDEVPAGRVH